MEQPPGSGILACDALPKSAPKRDMDDRIFSASFLETEVCFKICASIIIVSSARSTVQPTAFKISNIQATSDISGQCSSIVVPFIKRLAANSGSAAFFEPCTLTSPERGTPPVIIREDKPTPPISYMKQYMQLFFSCAYYFNVLSLFA